MSPETVARWQFGITTVYHFLFVPLTIALSLLTAVLQTIWTKTGNAAYLRLTKFFGKLFLINFAMGVVTGIVQEFQFGMNWSEYSRFVGDIFGAPLAMEALIAFFLESTFLGLWIFGWGRLSKGLHLTMIWLGSIGTLISSIFIIAANAWMQNPTGAKFENGRAILDDFGAVLLNPVFLTQWPHTIAASFVTAGAFIAGVAVFKLIRSGQANAPEADLKAYRTGAKWGAWVLVIAGLAVILTGDLLGKAMVQTQPAKMAAAEGLVKVGADWDATKAPFSVIPGVDVFPGFLNWLYGTDEVQTVEVLREQYATVGYRLDTNAYEEVAGGQQLTLQQTYAEWLNTPGNESYKEAFLAIDPIPSVTVSYWSFRLMMGVGCLAMLGGIVVLLLTRGGKTPKASPLALVLGVGLPLAPLVANSLGWIFSEMGRQPWIVNGVLPTQWAVSPHGDVSNALVVLLTLVLYTVIYGALAVVEVKLLLKYIKIGLPADIDVSSVDLKQDEDAPLSFAY